MRKLQHLGFVTIEEMGRWEVQPRGLRMWLRAVKINGPQYAEELRFGPAYGWDWAWKRT